MNIFNRTQSRLLDESFRLQKSYKETAPCPHLVIDELFDPEILYSLLNEFLFKLDGSRPNWQITANLRLESISVERLSDSTRILYFWLNSPDFVAALNLALGRKEKSLVGDRTFYGAGLWGILPGGKLESGGNTKIHPNLPLICEFNLIVCLNSNLPNNNEGNIELYSSENEHHRSVYQPQFNRTLVLPVTDKIKYRITTSDRSYESSKFFSIYYWSLI